MSAKRRKTVPKSGAVWRLSAEEAALAKKPKYNGYACGHGAHGSTKFDRAKSNRAWKKQLKQEGAQRGSFFYARGLEQTDGYSDDYDESRGAEYAQTSLRAIPSHPPWAGIAHAGK